MQHAIGLIGPEPAKRRGVIRAISQVIGGQVGGVVIAAQIDEVVIRLIAIGDVLPGRGVEIGDDVGVTGKEGVEALAPGQAVRAGPPLEPVIVGAAAQAVIPGPAAQRVATSTAEKRIIAGLAQKRVIAGATLDDVIARPGRDRVIAQPGADVIVIAGHPGQDGIIGIDPVAGPVDIALTDYVVAVGAIDIAISEGQQIAFRRDPAEIADVRGVVRDRNRDDRKFGDGRLTRFAADNRRRHQEDIAAHILDQPDRYSNGAGRTSTDGLDHRYVIDPDRRVRLQRVGRVVQRIRDIVQRSSPARLVVVQRDGIAGAAVVVQRHLGTLREERRPAAAKDPVPKNSANVLCGVVGLGGIHVRQLAEIQHLVGKTGHEHPLQKNYFTYSRDSRRAIGDVPFTSA